MEENLNNLISWLEINEIKVSTYLPKNKVNHPVLDKIEIIDNIIKSIKKGDLNAIELGCDLTIYNKLMPFGKALKCNIFNALKIQEQYINKQFREKLAKLAVKYLNVEYPPRETKELCRLLRKFEPQYSRYVIDNVKSRTEEAKRWIEYLN